MTFPKVVSIIISSLCILSCSKQIPVSISNQTNTDLKSYVLIKEVKRSKEKISYSKDKPISINLEKSGQTDIYLKTGKNYDIVFLDKKDYQYVITNIRIPKNYKTSQLVIHESDFEPRDPMEIITKKTALNAKNKEITHDKK